MLRSDIAKRKNTDPSEVRTCDLHIRSELVGRSNRYATDWREDVGEIQLRGATDTTPATDQKFASSNPGHVSFFFIFLLLVFGISSSKFRDSPFNTCFITFVTHQRLCVWVCHRLCNNPPSGLVLPPSPVHFPHRFPVTDTGQCNISPGTDLPRECLSHDTTYFLMSARTFEIMLWRGSNIRVNVIGGTRTTLSGA